MTTRNSSHSCIYPLEYKVLFSRVYKILNLKIRVEPAFRQIKKNTKISVFTLSKLVMFSACIFLHKKWDQRSCQICLNCFCVAQSSSREAGLASHIVSEDLCSGPLQIHRCFYRFISFVLELFFSHSLQIFVMSLMCGLFTSPFCNHLCIKQCQEFVSSFVKEFCFICSRFS